MSAIGWVPTAIPIAAALVLAGWAVVLTAMGRGMGRAFRWSGRVLVGLMVAVMVLSLARLGSAAPTANVGMLLGYLVAGIVKEIALPLGCVAENLHVLGFPMIQSFLFGSGLGMLLQKS